MKVLKWLEINLWNIMKQSDYFQGLLKRQKDNVKIYRNSECFKCMEFDDIKIKEIDDKFVIICRKCFKNYFKKI